MVAVDYADLLSITLPYNRHQFEDVMVVTTPGDDEVADLTRQYDAQLYVTDSFYNDGAYFNKWLALEEGLGEYGRHGLLCLMDADVLWPKKIPPSEYQNGILYAPRRRMMETVMLPIPSEEQWPCFRHHYQWREFAGYSQIFHAADPHLGDPPWHETDWRHAGGADSFFQMKWPESDKIRPAWDVLHLGLAGKNWCGRVTPYIDGTQSPFAYARETRLHTMLCKRSGKTIETRYLNEKITPRS